MRRRIWFGFINIGCLWCLLFGHVNMAFADTADLETIINAIEQRYGGTGFSASFFQESQLKAMDISDTARGRLTVKHPGKMRWEYTEPDKQIIIANGDTMWIYRPADHQVMTGRSPDFFGQGKGAGFLSDMSQIRSSFAISLIQAQSEAHFRLQLKPLKPTPDLADIILSVAKVTYQVDQVITRNTYGDETRIVLDNYRFNIDPDESLFHFIVPQGVEVIQLEP